VYQVDFSLHNYIEMHCEKNTKKSAAGLKFSYHGISCDVRNCNHETDNTISKYSFLHDKEWLKINDEYLDEKDIQQIIVN
jgi:hypothetical protein